MKGSCCMEGAFHPWSQRASTIPTPSSTPPAWPARRHDLGGQRYYCVRQLGLSKSCAFRRSETARLIARFPVIADRLAEGRVSIRALVELREVLTEENHPEVLARAEGKSQEEAQIPAVEYQPKPVPRDVVRALPTLPAPLVVPAETKTPSPPHEVVKPLTPNLRRLNVTVSADFMVELEQVRAPLSHKCPDGDFEQVVREAFKLVLEGDRKRKALTDRPRAQSESPGANNRYVPAAVKRAVWERDQGRCTWPMGAGKACGATHRLERAHDPDAPLGGQHTPANTPRLRQSPR